MFSKFTLKQSIGWIIGIIGLIFYIVGYAFKYNELYPLISEILIKIADVLIIGVVVGYLTSVAQWSGIFKREIQDIVFGKEFLTKRNDIEDIWYNVTKQMFKFKFADIHKDLLSTLRLTLPGEEDISYYEDHDSDISLEWIDREKGIVKSIEAITFTLVAESDKKIALPIRTYTMMSGQTEGSVSDPNILVDGKKPEIQNNPPSKNGDEIHHSSTVFLSGKKQYCVSYTREKTYCIYEDYFIGLKSQYLLKNLTVTLNLPEGIEATFIERGTNIEFSNVKKSQKHIKKKLKGVIFPKQGYIFALKVIPQTK